MRRLTAGLLHHISINSASPLLFNELELVALALYQLDKFLAANKPYSLLVEFSSIRST